MKKTTLLLIVLFFVLFSLSTLSFALTCEVRQECDFNNKETPILCLSKETNAHAELVQNNECSENYDYKLCCKDENGATITTNCQDQDSIIINLESSTNSHVQVGPCSSGIFGRRCFTMQDSPYNLPICISGSVSSECRTENFEGASCVLSLSDTTNAHIGKCEDYNTKVYCEINNDKDKDGYPAEIDCNDNPEKDLINCPTKPSRCNSKNSACAICINPGAPESNDFIDNDCDGNVDGDDSDSNFPNGWYQLSEGAGFTGYINDQVTIDENNFIVNTNDKVGIISAKVKIVKNQNYIVSVSTSCEINLQLIFDDNMIAQTNPSEGILGWLNDLIYGQPLENSITIFEKGKGATKPLNSGDSNFARVLITIRDGNGCKVTKPQLELSGDDPAKYNNIFEPRNFEVELGGPNGLIEPNYYNPVTSASCCPEKTCWNGFTCTENMVTTTKKVEYVDGNLFEGNIINSKAVYRCIDGVWKFGALLPDWNYQEKGFCSGKTQCFILNSEGGGNNIDPESFYQEGVSPSCIEDGDFIFDHYCDKGKWTSRTKFLAKQLLKIVGNNDYKLYCTNFKQALLDIENKKVYFEGENSPNPGIFSSNTNTCFNLGSNSDKRNLLSNGENNCVNNACILRYDDKTIFATSLNKEVDSVDSFLNALDINMNTVDCPKNKEGYQECDNVDGTLFYSDKYQSIIYSKDNFDFNNNPEQEDLDFLDKLNNGNDIYILKSDNLLVRGKRELLNNGDESLVIDYNGFSLPICEYSKRKNVPFGNDPPLIVQATREFTLSCTENNGLEKITITKKTNSENNKDKSNSFDILWPQLTTRIRPEN